MGAQTLYSSLSNLSYDQLWYHLRIRSFTLWSMIWSILLEDAISFIECKSNSKIIYQLCYKKQIMSKLWPIKPLIQFIDWRKSQDGDIFNPNFLQIPLNSNEESKVISPTMRPTSWTLVRRRSWEPLVDTTLYEQVIHA